MPRRSQTLWRFSACVAGLSVPCLRPAAEASGLTPVHRGRVVEDHLRHIDATRENSLDRTMKQQVGIATNRRREVGVGLVLQPVVTDVVG